jgi:hypothetical protein
MADYLFLYSGGRAPQGEEEMARVMKAWEDWYAELGPAIKDGGNPFGPDARTVGRGGTVSDGPAGQPATGYTIVTASSLDEAAALAKGSPVLDGDGAVTVYEIVEM